MFKSLVRFGPMFIAPLVLAACGDDDDGSGQVSMEAGAPTASGNETPGPFNNNPRGPGPSQAEDDSTLDSVPPPVPVEPPTMTTCGGTTCRDVLVGDIVVSPCCPAGTDGACGLDLSDVDNFMPVTDQCVALDQPGNEDGSCPTVYFDDPVAPQELPGCCMPEGLCGVVADLPLLADFGCVDPRDLLSGNGGRNDPDDEIADDPDDAGPAGNAEEPEPDMGEPQPASDFDGGPATASDAGVSVFEAGDRFLISTRDITSLQSCAPVIEEVPEPVPTGDDAGTTEPSHPDGGTPPVVDVDAGEGEPAPVVDASTPADAG